jgi:hypothetical protein
MKAIAITERLRRLFEGKKPDEQVEGVRPNRAQRRAAGFVRRGPAYKQTAPAMVRYFRRHRNAAVAVQPHKRTRRLRKQFARSMRAYQRRMGTHA